MITIEMATISLPDMSEDHTWGFNGEEDVNGITVPFESLI